MSNDLQTVLGVLSRLTAHDIHTWIFGGWGEELRQLAPSRAHTDIDLLYRGQDFSRVDQTICGCRFAEILAKRLAHKRAFVLDGVMVELFLVRSDHHGPHTIFWNRIRYDWPNDVFGSIDDVPVASTTALRGYRANYQRLRAPPN